MWLGSLKLYGSLRARPKSQSLTQQLLSTSRLPGLRSRCIKFAEWMKLRAHRELYIIVTIWSSSRTVPRWTEFRIFLRSDSIYSITRNICLKLFKLTCFYSSSCYWIIMADFDIDEYCPLWLMAEFLSLLEELSVIWINWSKPGVTMSQILVVKTLLRMKVSLRKI